jgi:hypothetical protein
LNSLVFTNIKTAVAIMKNNAKKPARFAMPIPNSEKANYACYQDNSSESYEIVFDWLD